MRMHFKLVSPRISGQLFQREMPAANLPKLKPPAYLLLPSIQRLSRSNQNDPQAHRRSQSNSARRSRRWHCPPSRNSINKNCPSTRVPANTRTLHRYAPWFSRRTQRRKCLTTLRSGKKLRQLLSAIHQLQILTVPALLCPLSVLSPWRHVHLECNQKQQ